jgi:hypothetical protein
MPRHAHRVGPLRRLRLQCEGVEGEQLAPFFPRGRAADVDYSYGVRTAVRVRRCHPHNLAGRIGRRNARAGGVEHAA